LRGLLRVNFLLNKKGAKNNYEDEHEFDDSKLDPAEIEEL